MVVAPVFFFHHFNTPFFSSSLISGTCHLHFHPHSFLPLTCNKNTEALDPSQKDTCASHAPSAFFLPPYLAPCTSITWFASRLQTQFGVLSAFWISTQDLLCGRKRTKKKKLQRYYTWKSKGMAVCVTCAAIWTLWVCNCSSASQYMSIKLAAAWPELDTRENWPLFAGKQWVTP